MPEDQFADRMEEIGAEEIYSEFRLRNPEKLAKKLEVYGGDLEEVAGILKAVVRSGETAPWTDFSNVREREREVRGMLETYLGEDAATLIMDGEPEDDPEDSSEGSGQAANSERANAVVMETDNFHVTVTDPHYQSGKLYAEITVSYKHDDRFDEFDGTQPLTSRGANKFAKTICEVNDLDTQDNYEELRKELKKAILKTKPQVQELYQRMEEEDSGGVFDEPVDMDERLQKALKTLYQETDTSAENIEGKVPDIWQIIQDNSDLMINVNGTIKLTERGEEEAERLLGIAKFGSEEEIEEKADEVLDEDFLTYYLNAFNKVHKGDHLLKVWELCSALSASSTERQIHSWAVGQSGKGKSHIKRCLTEYLLPDDAYTHIENFSPKALLYIAEEEGMDCFQNQVLFLDEADNYDNDDVIPLLRQLTDEDAERVKHITVKDQSSMTLMLEKPITIWFTSTESINDEQLKNRFILTNPDGSEDLDRKVLQHQKDRLHRGLSVERRPVESPVIKKCIQDLRENTTGLKLITPFDVNWKQSFNRRLYPVFYTLLELITKMHYRNREIREGYIIATKEDFELASMIWSELVATTVAQVDKDALTLVEKLPGSRDEAMKTSELAQEIEGFGTSKVRRKANMLMDTEEIALINGEKADGGRWRYWAGRDREKLVNPEPELISTQTIKQDIIADTDVEYDEELGNHIEEAKCPVLNTLEDMDFSGTEDNDFDSEVLSGVNGAEESESKNDADAIESASRSDYMELYPEPNDEPRSLYEIEQEVEERFPISGDEFFEEIHKDLSDEGAIFEPRQGEWKKA